MVDRRTVVGRLAPVVACVTMTGAAVLSAPSAAFSATVTLPDMRLQVPTSAISVGVTNGVRQLRFTHLTWDGGTGPFEIDPSYNSQTGTATFVQAVYNSPSPGVWQLDHTVPLSVTGVFHPPSDYQFPLTSFTLNQANADGTPGAVVATSPKTDYCITADTYVGGVANTPNQSFIPQSNCESPQLPLGWSVGWGDQYDQTDAGQPIDLTNVPDGTYVLVGTVDPRHVLVESSTTNDVIDTTVQIAGTNVTVLSQTNPNVTAPTVSMTAPAPGANVAGTVAVSATATAASPATIASVQFLLDGQPLGSPQTAAPYTISWVVGSTSPGSHTLSAQATDSTGAVGTAPGVTVSVAGSGLSVDRQVTATGRGAVTTAPFSTGSANETLIALVASDGPSTAGSQSATVTGAGLSWSLVRRSNTSLGDAEIWKAAAGAALSAATVTSTPAAGGYDQQLVVLSLVNAGGVGASAAAAARTGAPAVSLTATAAGSYTFGVGNDYDNAVGRTLPTGQYMLNQWLDTATGDTFWAQGLTAASTSAGQSEPLSDSAPTTDQWNLAAVEVVPAGGTSPPPDSTPPTVSLTNPTPGQTVTGTVPVAANATDNVAVATVKFVLDGQPLGSPVSSPPYAVSWDTTTAANGTHTLSAVATDTSGNVGTSASVTVTVQNPPPPMTCFVMQAHVMVHGRGAVTTPSFHTAVAGETLLAFVDGDGPNGGGKQTATVSGSGLTWTLVRRENAQPGDAEVWKATTTSILAAATVKATPARAGFDQSLNVIAMEGTLGVGASAIAAATSGAPTVSLTTTGSTALVFATGNDYDRATTRVLPTGQVSLDQWIDTGVGDTYWTQYTNAYVPGPGTPVTMDDTAPTSDRWNLVAVELVGDPT